MPIPFFFDLGHFGNRHQLLARQSYETAPSPFAVVLVIVADG